MNAIEKYALRLIGENVSSPDVFTDTDSGMAQIRQSVCDAIEDLCITTGSYTKIYHLPLMEDRQFYRMTPTRDHIVWVAEAWDREDKRKLIQTDITAISNYDPWFMKRNGQVTQYMMIGPNMVGVYQIPSAKGKVLELKCVCVPHQYTSGTDPIRLRDVFQRACSHYAASEFYASRGDANRAKAFMEKYLEIAGLQGLHPLTAERNYQYGLFSANSGYAVPAARVGY